MAAAAMAGLELGPWREAQTRGLLTAATGGRSRGSSRRRQLLAAVAGGRRREERGRRLTYVPHM
jgi:hypothetical protein